MNIIERAIEDAIERGKTQAHAYKTRTDSLMYRHRQIRGPGVRPFQLFIYWERSRKNRKRKGREITRLIATLKKGAAQSHENSHSKA